MENLIHNLIVLKKEGDYFTTDRFLDGSDIGMSSEDVDQKTIVLDKNSGKFAAPNGSIGHRWEQKGEWNLEKKDEENGLTDLDPVLTLLGMEDETGILHIPYFGSEKNEILQRGIPIKKN